MAIPWHVLYTIYFFQIFTPSTYGSASNDGIVNKSEAYTTCSKGWFEYGDLCYKVGDTAKKVGVVWEIATKACKEENGILATVYNQEISDFLSAFLLVPAQSSLWIGLDDRINETDYKWADGTPYNFTYYEPNEPSGVRNERNVEEDCMEMVYKTMKKHGKMGQWNDVRCNLRFPYLCQKAKDGQVSKSDTRWMFRNTIPELDPRYCMTEKGLGWRFEESCFYVVPEKKNWKESEEHCAKEYKGHLATLDYRVNYFINYVFREVKEEMWVGVKIKEETQQKWTSGWLVTFENWADQEKYENGTCVFRDANGAWIIGSCEKELWFLCEYSTSKAIPPVVKSSVLNTQCPKMPQGSYGWRDIGGDFCYFLAIDASVPWHEASYNCRKRGGTLASIHSQAEMDILYLFVRYYMFYVFYIGLYRPQKDANEFVWLDGSPVNFTRWTPGEPNNWNQAEQCTELLQVAMTWNDGECNSKMGYICSARKSIVVPDSTKTVFAVGPNVQKTEIPLIEECKGTIIIYALLKRHRVFCRCCSPLRSGALPFQILCQRSEQGCEIS